jgi:CRP-like cAMP-binding protein
VAGPPGLTDRLDAIDRDLRKPRPIVDPTETLTSIETKLETLNVAVQNLKLRPIDSRSMGQLAQLAEQLQIMNGTLTAATITIGNLQKHTDNIETQAGVIDKKLGSDLEEPLATTLQRLVRNERIKVQRVVPFLAHDERLKVLGKESRGGPTADSVAPVEHAGASEHGHE